MWELLGLAFFILLALGLRAIYRRQRDKGHQAFEAVTGRPPEQARNKED